MRVAVLSDVHGNLHALEAVLADVESEAPDAMWCLGDLVGYGPRPNPCCSLIAESAQLSLVGNHDLAVIGKVDLSIFTSDAAHSARWTSENLSPEAASFLDSLEPQADAGGIGLYHASPRDPILEYVLSPEAALAAFAGTDWRLILVGHSHVALALALVDSAVEGGLTAGGVELDLDGSARWLLNPGSVGQPRDGDPRAAYLLLDTDQGSASFRRLDYDIEQTQAEIRFEGLPESLAVRLQHGV